MDGYHLPDQTNREADALLSRPFLPAKLREMVNSLVKAHQSDVPA